MNYNTMLYVLSFICEGIEFYSCTCSAAVSADEWVAKCQDIENLRCDYLQIPAKRCIHALENDMKKIVAVFKH